MEAADGSDTGGSGGSGGSGSAGASGADQPVAGLDYTADELAQFAYQHVGEGELAGRPTFEQIHRTLTSVEGQPIPGQNAVRFDFEGVRVIINRDLPWRSTAYFPGS
jgi:CubicO group peptidase (beta-lactamase class C family)